MSDKPLFDLNGKYRLAYDVNQWVVQKRKGKPGERSSSWGGISFIGSEKRHLRRIFREKGIALTDDAIAKVDAMPETFFGFLREHEPDLARQHPIWRAARAAVRGPLGRSRQSRPKTTRQTEIAPATVL